MLEQDCAKFAVLSALCVGVWHSCTQRFKGHIVRGRTQFSCRNQEGDSCLWHTEQSQRIRQFQTCVDLHALPPSLPRWEQSGGKAEESRGKQWGQEADITGGLILTASHLMHGHRRVEILAPFSADSDPRWLLTSWSVFCSPLPSYLKTPIRSSLSWRFSGFWSGAFIFQLASH